MSIGPAQASETIRTGLAMGADRGILVKAEGNRIVQSAIGNVRHSHQSSSSDASE